MSTGKPTYNPAEIEVSRQADWAEQAVFKTPVPSPGQAAVYIKPSSPFTSGNLHMGHVRDYSIGDAYARFRRARGDAVLFGFGFDAFGLPAEMAAIQRGTRPAEWVERCGERMLGQMKRLGFSFDYERVFYSSDEAQYRWSQWLFVTLLEAGMVYRDNATVDWCDTCQTTLAALQVEDGRCWRCHNKVRLVRRPTWFLRLSPYLEENDRNLAELADWDELSLKTQRYILGRSDGVELDLAGPGGGGLEVFTPHADAVGEARFVLLSPRHPEVERLVTDDAVAAQLDELRSGGWERSARDAAAVPVIDTGASIDVAGGGHCRYSFRRSSMPAMARPPRSVSPRPTRPTRRSRRGCRAARASHSVVVWPPSWRLARRPVTGPMTSRSRASVTGARRSRLCIASSAAWSRSRLRICRLCCRATSSRPARAIRWPSVPIFSRRPALTAMAWPNVRPTRSIVTSTPSGYGCRPPCRPLIVTSRCSPIPTCRIGCPPSDSSPAMTVVALFSISGW